MSNSKVWKVLYKNKFDREWKELQGENGYWYADPILFRKENSTYLFTEAFCNITQKGCLAVSVLKNGEFTVPEIIIKMPYHLSYPCIFEFDNEVYMIPESCQNGTLELWKGKNNLKKWDRVAVLLDHVKYADTTVLTMEGKVYLFAYEEGINFKTHIYILDMETKRLSEIEEIEHQENKYRPAGKFVVQNGDVFRPVQYNVSSYGEKIIINKVTSLHPFKETLVKEITGDKYDLEYKGCNTHTISYDGDTFAVDYLCSTDLRLVERMYLIRKIRNLFFKIKYRLNVKL